MLAVTALSAGRSVEGRFVSLYLLHAIKVTMPHKRAKRARETRLLLKGHYLLDSSNVKIDPPGIRKKIIPPQHNNPAGHPQNGRPAGSILRDAYFKKFFLPGKTRRQEWDHYRCSGTLYRKNGLRYIPRSHHSWSPLKLSGYGSSYSTLCPSRRQSQSLCPVPSGGRNSLPFFQDP